jgi:uncharacterized OB-fold protein
MVVVSSKVDVLETPVAGDSDPWASFRTVERLNLQMTQQYRHSLGRYSRFFLALEQQRFEATTCTRCDTVYTPPRPLCPACLLPTSWVTLSGKGTLVTWAVMHYTTETNDDVRALPRPVVLAYVLLDGASTLFPHVLRCLPDAVKAGMRVRVAYAAERGAETVHHPIHLMHFVPLEEGV